MDKDKDPPAIKPYYNTGTAVQRQDPPKGQKN